MRLCLFLSAVFLFLPGRVPGAEAGAKTSERSSALAAIEKKLVPVKTMAAAFVQEKHLSIFERVLTSKGKIYFQAPDLLRWETAEPVVSGFSISGKKGKRWHELAGTKEAFNVDREPAMKAMADQLLACATGDMDRLSRDYILTAVRDEDEETPGAMIRLEPRSEAMKGYLKHMDMHLAADQSRVASVEVFEADGDFTRISFIDPVLNQPLPEGLF